MKLRELEKRLEKEPANLGLRVQVAGLMREAGRSVEAVEHYRAVALAYRDQGRTQQAISVCRSILEIAPADACQGLLATLLPPPPAVVTLPPAERPSVPARRSSLDETPLPRPIPHHVMDPTSQKYRLSESDLHLPLQPGDRTPLPGDGAPTSTSARAGFAGPRSSAEGGAELIDLAAEVDTRQLPKVRTDQLRKLEEVTGLGDDLVEEPVQRDTPIVRMSPMPRDSPATRLTPIPIARDSSDDLLTEPHNALSVRPSDEELTVPRERLPRDED